MYSILFYFQVNTIKSIQIYLIEYFMVLQINQYMVAENYKGIAHIIVGIAYG
jgi:hypothetical protein